MNKYVNGLLAVVFALFASIALASDKVNINTASAADLAEGLTGVAEQRAAAIVKDREANGPFAQPADIMRVKGIGQVIYEKNQSVIIVTNDTSDDA